jgi:3-deoxy-manno-octulosonate cytidylyltransferase (CMP-KDO synthetase)
MSNLIIPARFASTRLAEKLLQEIHGKSILQRVYEQCLKVKNAKTIIAVDNERLFDHAKSFGAEVMMTSKDHPNGTMRITEVVERLALDENEIVVNVQADEPFLPPGNIEQVINNLEQRPSADMATLCEPINEKRDVFDPSCVKVVMDHEGYAIYFSRAPIPYARDAFAKDIMPNDHQHYRHVGLYGYRAGFLRLLATLEATPLERAESLEQLRVLYYGHRIHVDEAVEPSGHGIDTESDLARARQ